jgi:hypothetical protein
MSERQVQRRQMGAGVQIILIRTLRTVAATAA